MAASNALRIDELIAAEMSPRDKLRALIVSRAGSVQAWAGSRGLFPQQVTHTLSGERGYPHIRDAIAADFDLPRDEVDFLIDGQPSDDAAEKVG